MMETILGSSFNGMSIHVGKRWSNASVTAENSFYANELAAEGIAMFDRENHMRRSLVLHLDKRYVLAWPLSQTAHKNVPTAHRNLAPELK